MIEGEFPHELKSCSRRTSRRATRGACRPTRAATGRRASACRSCATRRRHGGPRLPLLRRLGDVVRPARPEDRARLRARSCSGRGVRFGILGAREGSTGECVRRVGNEMLFQQLASALVATLGEVGATRIVTCDPHALNSLRNEYPELGGHYEVLHHTQLIAELLADGRIEVDASAERIVYHDPCYLGRHNGEFDAPRAILARLGAATAARVRAGAREGDVLRRGRRPDVDRRDDRHAHQRRCGSSRRSRRSPQTIATACPYCAVMMEDGLAALPAARHDPVARHRRAGGGRARRRGAGCAGIVRGDGASRGLKRAPAPTCPRAGCAAGSGGGSGGSPDRRRFPRARCDRDRAR